MNSTDQQRKIILFIPIAGTGNRLFYNSAFLDDIRHLDFQLEILKKLSMLKQFNIIVKCLKLNPPAHLSEILRDWIKTNHCENIIYREDKLKNSLLLADKVIMDFPGSSVMQAEHYNKRTLVLHYKELNVRLSAIPTLQNISLVKYTSVQEGIDTIEKFINEI